MQMFGYPLDLVSPKKKTAPLLSPLSYADTLPATLDRP